MTSAVDRPRVESRPAPPPPTAPFRAHGTLLLVGAVSWAASQLAVGTLDPEGDRASLLVFGAGSVLFQLGLLALLRVLFVSRALGPGRLARAVLRVESVLVGLAIASTTVDALGVSDLDRAGWALLDATWPLSMLGMFLIGVRVAVAGRWRGPKRYWPLVAESWALVVMPTIGNAGESVATGVSVALLLVGYAVLGGLVSRSDH
jgi:hypothetical protein